MICQARNIVDILPSQLQLPHATCWTRGKEEETAQRRDRNEASVSRRSKMIHTCCQYHSSLPFVDSENVPAIATIDIDLSQSCFFF